MTFFPSFSTMFTEPLPVAPVVSFHVEYHLLWSSPAMSILSTYRYVTLVMVLLLNLKIPVPGSESETTELKRYPMLLFTPEAPGVILVSRAPDVVSVITFFCVNEASAGRRRINRTIALFIFIVFRICFKILSQAFLFVQSAVFHTVQEINY